MGQWFYKIEYSGSKSHRCSQITQRLVPISEIFRKSVIENIQNLRLLWGISWGSNPSNSVCSLTYPEVPNTAKHTVFEPALLVMLHWRPLFLGSPQYRRISRYILGIVFASHLSSSGFSRVGLNTSVCAMEGNSRNQEPHARKASQTCSTFHCVDPSVFVPEKFSVFGLSTMFLFEFVHSIPTQSKPQRSRFCGKKNQVGPLSVWEGAGAWCPNPESFFRIVLRGQFMPLHSGSNPLFSGWVALSSKFSNLCLCCFCFSGHSGNALNNVFFFF